MKKPNPFLRNIIKLGDSFGRDKLPLFMPGQD